MQPVILFIIVAGNVTLATLAWVYFHKFQKASKKQIGTLRDGIESEKRLEKMREEFTAMMVHELRTPLTTINYTIDAISGDASIRPEPSLKEYLAIIKSESGEMLELVGELLDVAKIEAGKFEIVKVEDDLGKLIEEKMTVFKPLMEQKRLEFISEIGTNLEARFDRNRMGQVLENLLSNAAKFTLSGYVKVTARKTGGVLEVAISDSGEGIAADNLPKLFSKFEQLGNGKNGDKKGTGWGW